MKGKLSPWIIAGEAGSYEPAGLDRAAGEGVAITPGGLSPVDRPLQKKV